MLLTIPTAVTPLWTTMLGFSLLPAVVMIAGAALAVWRAPGPQLRSAILHFAAGVIFSVVAVELLPDIVHHHAPYEVGLSFGLGVAVMMGLRYLTQRLEQREAAALGAAATTASTVTAALPWGLLVAIGTDIFIDGLLLGIGFAAGAKENTLLAIALTIELLSLGLVIAVELRQGGHGKGRAVAIVAGFSLLLLARAGIGTTVLRGAAGNLLGIVLSFGLAALLFSRHRRIAH